jgi:prephenate dehydrogenase
MKTQVLLYGIGSISAIVEKYLNEDKVEVVGYVLDDEYKTSERINGKIVYTPH